MIKQSVVIAVAGNKLSKGRGLARAPGKEGQREEASHEVIK